MNSFISQYISQIFLALLVALAAYLGTQAKALYRKFITTEIKQAICRDVVRFVEQVYKDIHGPEKLAAAMERAAALLQEKGIEISELELITMLEAAVNEFNNAFAKDYTNGQHLPGVPVADPPIAVPEPIPTATAEEIIADMKDTD